MVHTGNGSTYCHDHLAISLFLNLSIYLLAVLGLRCFEWTFSSCGKRGLLSSCSAWASHCGSFSCCGARALRQAGFSSCGTQVYLLHGMWGLPRPGIESVSPA